MSFVSKNPLLLAYAQQEAAGGISRSLRFNSSDSAYLSRTPASAGNRQKFTWSAWVKRSTLGGDQQLFYAASSSSDTSHIRFDSDDTLNIFEYTTVFVWQVKTSQVFRDVSAWYHVLVAIDTTQATASDRVKVYINGVQVTAFGTATYPSQNKSTQFNNTVGHAIGRNDQNASNYLSAYLADCYLIDSQQLTPSSFTETDATTGQLIPKAYTGSYGTQGWHLEFADNSSNTATTLGKDTSGNGNNWTPNNLSIADGVTTGTGAAPIYNTNYNFTAKTTGTRTDSNSASIALAVAMDGTNGGTTFTDESATIKGSGSAKTFTVSGVTTSTAVSKFYGSSGFFGTGGTSNYIATSSAPSFSTSNFTVELWFYATASQNDRVIYRAVNNNGYGLLLFMNAGIVQVYISSNGSSWDLVAGTSLGSITTNQWTHIAVVRNGSTFTGYFNGSSVSLTTSSSAISAATVEEIGGASGLSLSFPGYMQDVRVYVGAAKYTAGFTVPSYSPSAAAGNDSLVDVPTNGAQTDTGAGGEVRGNYCTLNPLANGGNTLSNGNLQAVGAVDKTTLATIGMSSGKWYCEVTVDNVGGSCAVGIAKGGIALSNWIGNSAEGWAYGMNGLKYTNNNGGLSYGNTYTTGDVIGVAFDADAGSLYFYKNGTVQNSGTAAFTGLTSGPYFFAFGSDAPSVTWNFGQRPFAYTAPSGFKALNTASLPAPLVTKPNTVMDVALYTGNGSTQTISGLGFSPDFVWLKNRSSGSYGHRLVDSVRGSTLYLMSHSTGAEATDTNGVTAFNSDGFSLGNSGDFNVSSNAFVAWTWDAGSSTVTNTAGSITSSVRANATAGFSIVSYTGTGSTGTIGHGLGVAPSMLIVKSRSQSGESWFVRHSSLGYGWLVLNATNAYDNRTNIFTGTSPTSTVFSISGDLAVNNSGSTYIAYAFAPVVGYASMSSFVGNGSTDGPFCFTGFRPRFLLLKASSSTSHWHMMDTAREPYNQMDTNLFANLSNAELTDPDFQIDFLSNGFKLRTSGPSMNGSGVTYVWAAWADSPFNYSRAR